MWREEVRRKLSSEAGAASAEEDGGRTTGMAEMAGGREGGCEGGCEGRVGGRGAGSGG